MDSLNTTLSSTTPVGRQVSADRNIVLEQTIRERSIREENLEMSAALHHFYEDNEIYEDDEIPGTCKQHCFSLVAALLIYAALFFWAASYLNLPPSNDGTFPEELTLQYSNMKIKV